MAMLQLVGHEGRALFFQSKGAVFKFRPCQYVVYSDRTLNLLLLQLNNEYRPEYHREIFCLWYERFGGNITECEEIRF